MPYSPQFPESAASPQRPPEKKTGLLGNLERGKQLMDALSTGGKMLRGARRGGSTLGSHLRVSRPRHPINPINRGGRR